MNVISRINIESFTIVIHKKNGKIKNELNIEGAYISDEVNTKFKRYKGKYITIKNIKAKLECGLELIIKSPDPMILKFS